MNRNLIVHTLFTASVAAFVAFGLAYVLGNFLQPFRAEPIPTPMSSPWIKAAGEPAYASYFRHTFTLDGTPRRAWLRVAARDAFEISINNDVVGRSFLWRPTRPFQTGLSEKGQAISASPPLLTLNYPREYQWRGHREYRLPVYFDITPYLRQGSNLIAIKVESRTAPAVLSFEGSALLWSGEAVAIKSSEQTMAEIVPPARGQLLWDHINYSDIEWHRAKPAEAPSGSILTLFDPSLFSTPFDGNWLRASATSSDDRVIFSRTWALDKDPKHGWIRILSNRAYELFVNGRRVHARTKGKENLADGDWIIGTSRALDHVETPELLDPDEIGELTAGKHFLQPPSREKSASEQTLPTDSLSRLQNFNVFRNRNSIEGGERIETSGSLMVFTPDRYRPESRVPTTLARNRQIDSFDAFDVSELLREGENQIIVRLLPHHTAIPLSWQEQIAVDAAVTLESGEVRRMHSDHSWTEAIHNSEGQIEQASAFTFGAAVRKGMKLPRLFFQGFSYNQRDKFRSWGTIGFAIGIPLAALLIFRHRMLVPITFSRSMSSLTRMRLAVEEREMLAESSAWLLLPAATLFATLVTKYAWSEREEILMFNDGSMWQLGLITTACAWLFSTWWIFGKEAHLDENKTGSVRDQFKQLPLDPRWKWLVFGILVFGVWIRAIHVDFQTIDDDEYASMQAIKGILETGTPQLNEDIWYTRSPLYHYLAAAVTWLFGFNLWSLRLLSVFWGGCTAYLTYLCGKRILKSPWIGLGAMVLYSIHPFLIYTAHISRFYQQQQFFALLTVYFFCLGFAGTTQKIPYRLACIVAFLCAILSQELSIVMGFQLLLGYMVFARPEKWHRELKTIVLALCVIALVAVDILIFQTKTLTILEGVSPNVEATMHPNFTSPMNYFSIFLGYSRLHLPLSILLFIGIPFAMYILDKQIIAFYFMLFSGIVFVNILVTGNSLRYQYSLIPMWILLGLLGPKLLADRLTNIIRDAGRDYNPTHLKPALCSVLFVAILISWSPWRIPGSYQSKLLGDASGAFQYISTNLREGDKVAATEPHPHGAMLETGRADYDITFPLLYDFVYEDKAGNLLDRNAQAQVISTVEDLMRAFAKHDRIWIAINREKFRSRGKNLRWEYPGARAELFLRKNCTLAYESYLWSVFLWDANEGRFSQFRHNWAR